MPVAPERQAVAEFLQRWLKNTAKPRLRPRTFVDYTAIVDRHLVPTLGKLSLQKLGPEHVQELFRAKTEAGLSARRVAVIRAVLHTALHQAMQWGAVERNVADLVSAPRRTRYQPTTLNEKQARALVKAAGKGRRAQSFSIISVSCLFRACNGLRIKLV